MEEIFESSVRSAGDLAGVFEFDGDASYFYLYDVRGSAGKKVLEAIKISVGEPDFLPSDVIVIWSLDQRHVFLKIGEQICAAFDSDSRQKFGGDRKVGV